MPTPLLRGFHTSLRVVKRESFGSAITASSRPAAVAPSRIEQNRDDQDESVQGILVAGADQRRVRRMDVQIDPRDA